MILNAYSMCDPGPSQRRIFWQQVVGMNDVAVPADVMGAKAASSPANSKVPNFILSAGAWTPNSFYCMAGIQHGAGEHGAQLLN